MPEVRPLVSVITVVRNAASEIEATLRSIADLKTSRLEHIVLDGGSTDGTLDIIKRYAPHIDHWSSGSDRGIYDAMNKALAFAHGDYVININAGDRLLSIPQCLGQGGEDAALYCACVKTEADILRPRWGKGLLLRNTLPHQGCFYKREVLQARPYNLSYKIFADYDLNLRLYHDKVKAVLLEDTVAFHATDGISNQSSGAEELFRVVRDNNGRLVQCLSWGYFKLQGLKSRWTQLNS